MTLVRVGAGVLGLLAAAWFALGVYQSHAVSQAAALAVGADGRLSSAEARRADDLLGDAGTLNPDRSVDVLRAQVALAGGDTARSRQILSGVVASEPQNLDAWIALARASTATAAGVVRERQIALLNILKLAPIVKPVG